MPATQVFYPHGIRAVLIADGTTELFMFSLIDDMAPSYGFEDLTSWAAAQVGPQEVGVHRSLPDLRWSTPQLGTLEALMVTGDYYLSRDLSLYNVDVLLRAGLNLNSRVADATTAHLRGRMAANAMLIRESIVAEEGQLASARCRIAAVLNSQTGADPLAMTAGVANTGNASGGALYTLGPVKLNGSFVNGVTYCGIEFNPEYDEVSTSGEGFLTYIGIRRYRPVITIRTRQSDYMATFGSRGTNLSSLSFWLREKLPNNIVASDATAAHVKYTATTGVIKARAISGPNADLELTIEPYQASQNTPPLVVAVNQTIS
jgi:hypothetical protein